MKFRYGLAIGLGIGYYLGAKAGQERYEQIERILDKVRAVPGYPDARDRVVDLYGAGRDIALSRLDEATGGAASTIFDLRDDAGFDPTVEFDFDADLTTVYDAYADDEPTA